jgi:hypothetical protein
LKIEKQNSNNQTISNINTMKRLFFLTLCFMSRVIFAQDISYSKPGKNFYQELPDPAITQVAEWAKPGNDINVSFASDNIRYPKKNVPEVSQPDWDATAWKGEKVHTQVLVWTKKDIPALKFEAKDLIDDKGNRINKNSINMGFVRYVMTDEFGNGCGKRKKSDYDSSLVEDPIDIISKIPVKANTVQPIWVSIKVPANTPAGKYNGTITINAIKKFDLKISLIVLNHILPPPSEWKYDLDLWQSGASIAKVHDIPLWSEEHFKLMKSYFAILANAGQKNITANIIEQPWGKGHVYHDDPTYIKWMKRKDGSWKYDYSIFDKYIETSMSSGINKRINCYSMVTWDLAFIYFDEGLGRVDTINAKPGSQEYTDFWTPMLKDFTKHLKEKGWFGKTSIAMDERPMESMKAVISLLKQIDPAWKIALAGNYHPEIEMDIFDYCLELDSKFSEASLKQRKALGMPSTFYTACPDAHPNGFTYSPPAENAWISWYAAQAGFTGYLRWAYNNWTEESLIDSRFRTWPAGDLYQIYPGPRSSIRFEKFIEGIQDFEKIRILREQFTKDGNQKGLAELQDMLSEFQTAKLKSIPASEMVTKARVLLNKY